MLRDIETKPNIKNWASLLRNILSNLGFLLVWLSQGVGDIKQFLVVLKQRLTDNFLQEWQSRLNDSSSAAFYITFSNFCLDIVLTKKFRVAMTRLRVSSHRLNIEAGRWSRPQVTPREERKCLICNKLEDEYHFLFECALYDSERNSHIKLYFRRRPNMAKAVELLRSTNKLVLNNLAIFVYKSFQIRNEVILRQ